MRKKNPAIELVRGICSVLVVFIHCPFPGVAGQYITGFSRMAVPFFLLVSGYFACRGDAISYAWKKIVETLRLAGVLTLVYGAVNTLRSIVLTGSVIGWILPYCNWTSVLELLLLNRANFISWIMWYLISLVYVYGIYAVASKTRTMKLLYGLTPLLLMANLVVSEYLGMPWYYAGNFLLTSLPFFCVGHFLRYVKLEERKCPTWLPPVGVIVGMVLTAAEIHRDPRAYCYVGTIIAAVCVFIWCVQGADKKLPKTIARFSSDYSVLIFALHCAVKDLLELLPVDFSAGAIKWGKPLIVLGITILVSGLLRWVGGRWAALRANKSDAI